MFRVVDPSVNSLFLLPALSWMCIAIDPTVFMLNALKVCVRRKVLTTYYYMVYEKKNQRCVMRAELQNAQFQGGGEQGLLLQMGESIAHVNQHSLQCCAVVVVVVLLSQ